MSDHIEVNIIAVWDEDAGVWSASSDDLLGLAIESSSMDDLHRRLRVVVPEMLELNGLLSGREFEDDVPLDLLVHSQEQLALSH